MMLKIYNHQHYDNNILYFSSNNTVYNYNITNSKICPKCNGKKFANNQKCPYCDGLGDCLPACPMLAAPEQIRLQTILPAGSLQKEKNKPLLL
mgnify:CR=1 FL=1